MATPNRFFFRWQSTAVESFGRGTVEAAHALYVKNGAALRYKAPVVRYHGGVAQSVATTAVDQLPDQSVVYARVLTPTQLALYSSKAAAVQGGPGGLISKGVAEQARLTELLDEAERGSFFLANILEQCRRSMLRGWGRSRGAFSRRQTSLAEPFESARQARSAFAVGMHRGGFENKSRALVQRFGERIPAGQISMAKLQGYLMRMKLQAENEMSRMAQSGELPPAFDEVAALDPSSEEFKACFASEVTCAHMSCRCLCTCPCTCRYTCPYACLRNHDAHVYAYVMHMSMHMSTRVCMHMSIHAHARAHVHKSAHRYWTRQK